MNRKGVTLLELLIAISLLLLVLAAAMSVDMAGQWFFKSTRVQAEIQDELQPAMEHMIKNIQLANDIYRVSSDEVRVKIDYNDPPTFDNPNDDLRVIYRREGEDILYGTDTRSITDPTMPSFEPIAKWITNNDIFSLSSIFLTIKLQGERVIQQTPEIKETATLVSGVTLRCRRAG